MAKTKTSSQLDFDFGMKVKGDSGCSLCPLHKTTSRVCTMGFGSDKSGIMIIGEAPGRAEEETGKPFQGKAGHLLDSALARVKLDRSKIYVSNAVQCRPPDNRTPKRKEIAACKVWVQKEIARIKPKFVVLMGNAALESVLGQKGIKAFRGKPIDQNGVIYFPLYHPAYALRDPKIEVIFQSDWDVFARIYKQGGIIAKDEDFKYTIVTTENLHRALADIKKEKRPALDTETSGLDPWAPGSYITSVGIGTKNNNWTFPMQHTKGELYDKPNTQKRLMKRVYDALHFKRKGKRFIAHNGKFDSKWIRVIFDLRIDIDFDTMLAHYNLDENTNHGLDILAQRFLQAIDYDIPLSEKHGFGPLDRHCRYLGQDIYYTRSLYFLFRYNRLPNGKKWVPKAGQAEMDFFSTDPTSLIVFEKLTMPVARMYADIEFNGIYVDQKRLAKERLVWKKQAEESLAALDKICPSDQSYKNKKTGEIRVGVNWGSPDQLADVLFTKMKIKPIKSTPGGKHSTDESVLLQLAKKHPIAKLILQYREALKNLGTFIDGWKKRLDNNSRFHCTFKVFGTVTGRPSAEEPNLQQTPRDPSIRSNITAPPGWTLVDADLSQIELRLTAEASKDPALVLAYMTGGDVHTQTVQTIFGIQSPTKEERKKGKAINFGFIYGMGWRKFKDYARDNYGVDFTDAECERIRKAFFRLYHKLPDWHSRQRKFVTNYGYVRNLIGRKRRLPEAMIPENQCSPDQLYRKHEAERQAINSPIQSLASDMDLSACVALHEKYGHTDFFRIVGTVHDSILIEVRNDKLDEVCAVIKHMMEHPPLLDELEVFLEIPIEAEIETGPWASGKKWVPTNDNKAKLKKKAA